MRLLILQFVAPGQGESLPTFSHNLGVLAALLKQDGFECRLAALGGYRPDPLKAVLARHSPDCVLVEINPYSATAAHRAITDIAQAHRLPVVICGQYATCLPTKAVSIPGVRALLLGEYDQSGPALFKQMRDGGDGAGTPGVWVNGAGGLVRSPVPPLVQDLDSLPFPDRDVFDYSRLVQQGRQAGFKVARGCPRWCAQCVNDWYMDLYSGKGTFLRRRSVVNVLEEVHAVVGRYGWATAVAFYDHGFAADADWLKEFTAAYPRRCALPYRCFVPAAGVTGELAARLAASNCRWVTTQIGSGSRFLREEILSLHASEEAIVAGCGHLREHGIAVTAEVFVGCPYESEITIEETLALLRRCEVDEVRAKVFYPTPGTRSAELCAENGWISGRGEENYWLQRSVLDMPSMPASQIDALAARLPAMVGRPGMLGKLLGRIIGRKPLASRIERIKLDKATFW